MGRFPTQEQDPQHSLLKLFEVVGLRQEVADPRGQIVGGLHVLRPHAGEEVL